MMSRENDLLFWSLQLMLLKMIVIGQESYAVETYQNAFLLENLCLKELFCFQRTIYIYIYIILGRQSPYGYRANISNIIKQ